MTKQGVQASWRALRIGFYVLSLLVGIGSYVQGQTPDQQSSSPVYVVDINDVINPGSAALLQYAIETAEANQAAVLIIRINTPGGLISSTRDMVSAIGEARVPTIGYVGPSGARATSAGAFILLSTHIAVMNTGTNVGASSPVAGDGADIEGTMGKKVMNDTRAFMRSVATSRNRNAEVAEGFVTDANSLTAGEAKDSNVIDLVVEDFTNLLGALEGREIQIHGDSVTLNIAGSEIKQVEHRLIDRLLKLIAHPQIAYMLISLGVLAIYVEILSPGLAFPGVLGAIAVILGLVGMQALPVNTGFLMLLFLGLSLMVAEYFVVGLGILGIGGAVAFVLGSINLFDIPTSTEHQDTILSVSIAVSAAMLITTFLITRSVIFGSRNHASMKDKVGEAMVSFEKNGYVLIEDQRWSAKSLEPLQHGDTVIVVDQTENGLLVKKI